MNAMNGLVDRYIAIWNETDAGRRHELIAQTWTEDASYVDPMMRGEGHAGIDTMVQAVQQRFPGHRFQQAGTVDAHHDRVRFGWELVANGAATPAGVIARGTDFGIVAGERLQAVTGFLEASAA